MRHTVGCMWADMRGRYRPELVGRVGVVDGEDGDVDGDGVKGGSVREKEKVSGAETPEEKVVVKSG